jgi:hypothetical protein
MSPTIIRVNSILLNRVCCVLPYYYLAISINFCSFGVTHHTWCMWGVEAVQVLASNTSHCIYRTCSASMETTCLHICNGRDYRNDQFRPHTFSQYIQVVEGHVVSQNTAHTLTSASISKRVRCALFKPTHITVPYLWHVDIIEIIHLHKTAEINHLQTSRNS